MCSCELQGEMAHCGFPEAGVGRMTEALTSRGYKVHIVHCTVLSSYYSAAIAFITEVRVLC